MTAEVKLRTLAQQDATLQAIFFDGGQVRWFDRQLTPGYLKLDKTCARVRRISTVRMYAHETDQARSQCEQAMVRFQIDVLDLSAERARSAAEAVIDWLSTVDFSSDAQFASPVTSPKRHPNFVIGQRSDMDSVIQPPAYVESIDVRIFNLEE